MQSWPMDNINVKINLMVKLLTLFIISIFFVSGSYLHAHKIKKCHSGKLERRNNFRVSVFPSAKPYTRVCNDMRARRHDNSTAITKKPYVM